MDPATTQKLRGNGLVSSPGVISQLALGDLPMSDVGHLSSMFEQYFPTFPADSNNPVDILVSPSNLYTDLSNIWLYVSGKITKKDGTSYTASNCAPANNFLHSLWSNFELTVGNTPLTRNSNFYPYLSYITRALCSSAAAKDGKNKTELMGIDAGDSRTSAAYAYRKSVSANSKKFCVMGRPVHGFFDCNRYLVPNTSMRLTFRRAPNEFIIDHELLAEPADGTKPAYDGTFKMESCYLLVRRVAVGQQVQDSHQLMLERNIPLRYPYMDKQVISYSLSKGTMSNVSEALSVGPLPSRVIVGFVESDAFFGNYPKTAFNFKPFNIEGANLLINGEVVLYKNMDFNIADRNYLMAYVESLLLSGDTNDTSPDRFADSQFFLCYNLLPAAKPNSFASNREGVLRFEAKFREKLDDSINVVVFMEYQTILNVTRDGASVQTL